ncbi:MAG: hypothetical protein K2Q09_04595, partial [Phycisphaerales bacterium]|nr:hypothetical protein [Phycisphaerales bacterium]
MSVEQFCVGPELIARQQITERCREQEAKRCYVHSCTRAVSQLKRANIMTNQHQRARNCKHQLAEN